MSEITLVRRIAARPSIVFEAITTSEGIASWWGPEELPVVRAESDARIGGTYRVHFRTTDGRDHEAHGEFLEMVPPRRLVMTYRYAFGGEPEEVGRTSRIEIDIAPIDGGSELTFKHSGLASDVSAKSHAWGWTGAFDKLVRNMDRLGLGTTADTKGGTR